MDDRDPVEVLADEFVARVRNGDHPSIDEYTRQYPEYEDEIRGAFPVLLVLEDVASEDADEFEDDGAIDLASGDESRRITGQSALVTSDLQQQELEIRAHPV